MTAANPVPSHDNASPVLDIAEGLYKQMLVVCASVDEAMAVVQVLNSLVQLDFIYRSQREAR